MKNPKRKGNAGERDFADWLQSKGVKAYRNSSSGNNQWKSDVHNNLGLNIEVKTVKRLNLLEAWKQTDRDSSLAKTSPLLAVHFDRMPQNEWLIVLHSEDWIEMLSQPPQTQPASIPSDTRELKYLLDQLKLSTQRVLKKLDEEV